MDDQDGSYAQINEHDYIFVNMEENEETYTAFDGGPIWRAIYEENCFLPSVDSVDPSVEEFCSEANLLYHLVSGLHASVNTHISEGFENPRNATELVNNSTYFLNAVGDHEDRVKNLYFLYAATLKAVRLLEGQFLRLDVKTGVDANMDNLSHWASRHLI